MVPKNLLSFNKTVEISSNIWKHNREFQNTQSEGGLHSLKVSDNIYTYFLQNQSGYLVSSFNIHLNEELQNMPFRYSTKNQTDYRKCIRKDIRAPLLPTSFSGGGILASSFSDSASISSSTFFTLLLPSSVILRSRSWRSDEVSLLIRLDLSVTDILIIDDLQTIVPVTINT